MGRTRWPLDSAICWASSSCLGSRTSMRSAWPVPKQELAALSLHLLQICLVYVNTLLIQQVLSEPRQFQQMKQEDLRALTPLIYSHVTPYGTLRLNLTERIPIEQEAS